MTFLCLVVFIDETAGIFLRNLAFDVPLRRGEQILRRLEAVNILKTDGRGPGIRTFAHARLRSLVILVKVFTHVYHFGGTVPFAIGLSRVLLLFFHAGSIPHFRGSRLVIRGYALLIKVARQ